MSANKAISMQENEIVLYQPNDAIHLEVRMANESVWLNRNQMAILFGRDVKTIGKHINNALHGKEDLSSSYIGKSVKNLYGHSSNPVKYINM